MPGHDPDHPGHTPAGYPDLVTPRHAGLHRSLENLWRSITGIEHLDAAFERPQNAETVGVVYDAEIGEPSGCNRAPVMEPEPFGGGECRHPERQFDIETVRDRFSDTVVYMPIPDKRPGMPVVGCKTASRRRAPVNKRQEAAEVLLGRPLPDHDVHPPEESLTRLGKRR